MPNVEGIPEERNITDYLFFFLFLFLIICGVFCIVVIIVFVFAEHLLTWEVIFKKCVSSI